MSRNIFAGILIGSSIGMYYVLYNDGHQTLIRDTLKELIVGGMCGITMELIYLKYIA